MSTSIQHYAFNWQGREITVDYNPDYSTAFREAYGDAMAHLEIRCAEPLPITGIGYRSHFVETVVVEGYKGAVALVKLWLTQEAETLEWKQYEQDNCQMSLF